MDSDGGMPTPHTSFRFNNCLQFTVVSGEAYLSIYSIPPSK